MPLGSSSRGTPPAARSRRTTRRRRARRGFREPDAVFSAYPGRAIGDIKAQLKPVDGRNIPAGTRMLVLGGAGDTLVGTRWARQIARDATRADVTLRIVRDPAADDHTAPTRDSAEARRAFWKPLDRLVDAAK